MADLVEPTEENQSDFWTWDPHDSIAMYKATSQVLVITDVFAKQPWGVSGTYASKPCNLRDHRPCFLIWNLKQISILKVLPLNCVPVGRARRRRRRSRAPPRGGGRWAGTAPRPQSPPGPHGTRCSARPSPGRDRNLVSYPWNNHYNYFSIKTLKVFHLGTFAFLQENYVQHITIW